MLKLTFSYWAFYSNFDNAIFLIGEFQNFTDLSKLSTPIQTEFFQVFSKFCIYVWDIYSSKNSSEVSFTYMVNKQRHFLDTCFCYFLNLKYFFVKIVIIKI